MRQELTANESPDTVLARLEERVRNEFPHPLEVLTRTPNSLWVNDPVPFFPETGLGWAINLTLTVITLGAWLPFWFLGALYIMAGTRRDYLEVTAFPAETQGESKVVVESSKEAWGQLVLGGLTERYS